MSCPDVVRATVPTGPAVARVVTPGPAGASGDDGADGREIELQTTATHIQWRQTGGNWANLIALSALIGPPGSSGVANATAPITYDAGTKTVGITPATTSAAGSLSAADKTKLDGIATGATANATDAQLRDRSTHTGNQSASTITGLASVATSGAYADLSGRPTLGTAAATDATAYATAAQGAKADTAIQPSDNRLTDAREWSAATVSQADAEAGTATDRRAWTVQRVWQAISAWWAASSAKTKLDGIATGATANQADAYLLSRANHTGTQLASTISDSTAPGRALLTATDAAAQRTALGLKTGAITNITISTSDPSGGDDGDIWIKYTA